LEAVNDLDPRIKILGTAPGLLLAPFLWISTPEACPCIAEARLDAGTSLIACSLIEVMAPVTSDFLRVPYTGLATVANVRTIPVPADFIREWDEDQMSIATSDGSIQSLVKDELGFLRIRFPDTGSPQNYALVNDLFYFFPLPDQVYPISGTYYANDAILSTNIENKWLLHLSELIIGKAGFLLASGLRDKDALQIFAAMSQAGGMKLANMTTANDAAGAKPVMGGED